jgi:hypothetical protein
MQTHCNSVTKYDFDFNELENSWLEMFSVNHAQINNFSKDSFRSSRSVWVGSHLRPITPNGKTQLRHELEVRFVPQTCRIVDYVQRIASKSNLQDG